MTKHNLLQLTIAKAMALEILRDDMAAAYALADKLIEERNKGPDEEAAELLNHGAAHDGYAVYGWPEFRLFCKRLGVLWHARTIRCTIYINEGEAVRIVQEYQGSDAGE